MRPLTTLTYLATYLLGLVYPAYVTVNALESPGTQDDHLWLIYWLLYSLISLAEAVLWPALKYLGFFYYLLKAALLAWLVLPQTKGATYVYEQFVAPGLKQAGAEARKVPQIKLFLEKVDAFTAGKPVTKTGTTAGTKIE
jgi:receptor expression-enhancing protein 5/6